MPENLKCPKYREELIEIKARVIEQAKLLADVFSETKTYSLNSDNDLPMPAEPQIKLCTS